MVDAERSFAQTSKEKSTKEAFATYMNDSGFIFKSSPYPWQKIGQMLIKDLTFLHGNPYLQIFPLPVILVTRQAMGISSKRNDPSGTGYYISVWKKEKDGGK